MGELDFAPIHCHTREQESVLDIMREVRRLVSEGKPEVGRVLTRELAPWFESHAAGMDAMLAFFLRCEDAGIDPMQALAAQSQGGCSAGAASTCTHDAEADELTGKASRINWGQTTVSCFAVCGRSSTKKPKPVARLRNRGLSLISLVSA